MTKEEAKKEIEKVFVSEYANYIITALTEGATISDKALEHEPKYCDRNICISNEYNGIGCDKCEVTKSQEKIRLTNKEWIDLISENFGVSRSVAKEMLHNMLNTPKYKYREV